MRLMLSCAAVALVTVTSVLRAQDPPLSRSLRPDSGAFFFRKELQLLQLKVVVPLNGNPDCQHDGMGFRGGSLSFRHAGPVTYWTIVDTIVTCDRSGKPHPSGTRRDSGYVTVSDPRRVMLHPGYHSPVRVSIVELRWLNIRRDSLVLFGSDSLRRDLYVAAPAPKRPP
jgi:hypothetical protein